MRASRRQLYLVAAVLWLVPGVIISTKGVSAYLALPTDYLPLCIVATVAVIAFFALMFNRVVSRYSAHIASLSEPASPLRLFPRQGWILMAFMVGLGMLIGALEDVPTGFIAAFYSGLGPMLILSSARFALHSLKR